MRRNSSINWRIAICFLVVATVSTTSALAVAPNPLESAYWRFEGGTEFSRVAPRDADVVIDSLDGNNLRAFQCDACGPGGIMIDAAPTYVSTVPPDLPNGAATN